MNQTPLTHRPCGDDVYPFEVMVTFVFQEVSYDTLLQDVAMTVLGCCFQPGMTELDWDLARPLLEAYDAARPLTEFEKKNLPAFVRFSALAIATWRFRYLFPL